MKERPILFSAPMVRAVLKGSKTQTRRVVKPQPPAGHNWAGWCVCSTHRADEGKATWAAGSMPNLFDAHRVPCPYGMPGDRLWVREAWQSFFEDEVPLDRPRGPRHTMGIPAQPDRKSFVFYRADGPLLHPDGYRSRWFPSIHMPRKYSRITLQVTNVGVERLQDISEADAWAEGAPELLSVDGGYLEHPMGCYRDGFQHLWTSINGPGSWDTNPWVWVVEFRRLDVTRLLDA